MSSNGEEPEQGASTRVGYCNPPESTRFKKGQSGNPKGRPKGTLNVRTVLANTLRERVVINEHGQRKTVSKLEAAIKQLVNKAASGDLRALRQFVDLARDAEKEESLSLSQTQVFGEVDQKVIQGILKRFEASNRAQEGERDEPDGE